MTKPLFIAFEGIDGSGKSTQVKLLSDRLIALGHNVYPTFEPSNGEIGLMIRKILKGETKADERTIAALFVADRLDHLLNEKIGLVKKLEEGITVITDRYYFSNYAYNGTQMDMQWVINANSLSADILRPDLTIFIDLAPEISMERLTKNRETIELYENLENLKAVRAKYLEAFELLKNLERVAIVNGNQTPEMISDAIWTIVSNELIAKANT
jgi:dTMP kinase